MNCNKTALKNQSGFVSFFYKWSFVRLLKRPVADTTRGRDGGQGSCDGGYDDLQDHFPDVILFHSFLLSLDVYNNSFAAAIVSSDIKRRLSTTAIAFMSAGHSFSVSLSFPPKLVSLHTAAM